MRQALIILVGLAIVGPVEVCASPGSVRTLRPHSNLTVERNCLRRYITKDQATILLVNDCPGRLFVAAIEMPLGSTARQCTVYELPERQYGRAYAAGQLMLAEPPKGTRDIEVARTHCRLSGYPPTDQSDAEFVVIREN
ncbi:MAG: hypothetical protein QF921_05040 [Pseudomonadales bacterium]|jgi:hypothetical protein|nr:hypothetical protein [Pseudomonadales bacterium]MDP6471876.1 hypothetical protein [Pseudomonadales bacterium]MDP6826854.1 hypothetical protein [Pseudomonadales bacterium]MDP6970868.1 hypothetical protein [Pseudomonadales bacterium]|tara:strand:+ start:17 stop:433 length:417 start_codon:yes stop_codon:yes gene_type:complete